MSTYKGRTVTVLDTLSSIPNPVSETTVDASVTAVEAAVAVLEADGATPTQAHVNSLRTVWNTLKTNWTGNKTQEHDIQIIRYLDNSYDKVKAADIS